jgi:RiboL-PSP-HEPN
MATPFAENALREFNATLDELDTSVSFLRAAVRLRPRLNDWLRWETMEADARELAIGYISQKSFESSAFYRGAVIVLSGAFEQLVRRLVQEYVVRVNESAKDYDSLSEAIKRQNTLRTGHALATVMEPLDHQAIDYTLLAKNIGTCLPGVTEFVLNAPAFTLFISSISPRHLEDVLKRVGIVFQWDEFGSDAALRQLFDERNTRPTAKATEDYLTNFITTRNRVAHTGSGGVIIQETEIEGFLKFFRAFSTRLIHVLNQRLPT